MYRHSDNPPAATGDYQRESASENSSVAKNYLCISQLMD